MVEELKIAEGFQQTEAGVIPNDWVVKPLHKVAHFENGKAHEQFIDEHGDYIVVNSKFISTEGRVKKFSKKNIFPLKKGDITIVMSDIPKGKALAKCFLIDKNDTYTLNQRIGGITANDDTDNKYLFYKLNRNKYYLAFDSGTGQTNIKRQEILDCPVALPPTKKEQISIAVSLDNVDELITGLESILLKKRNIKQGAMQRLLFGHQRLKNFKKSNDFQKTEIGSVTNDWEVLPIKELIKRNILQKPLDGNHGDIHPKSSDFVSEGIPFIMANNIKNGVLNTNDCHFITKKQADSLRKGFSVTGDVLLTHKGTVGNVAIVGKITTEYIMLTPQVTYYRVKDKKRLDNRFMKQFFESNSFQNLIKNVSGGGTRAYIGIVMQQNLPFVLPPIMEQISIAEILSVMDKEIEHFESQLLKYKMLRTGISQELLTGKKRLI